MAVAARPAMLLLFMLQSKYGRKRSTKGAEESRAFAQRALLKSRALAQIHCLVPPVLVLWGSS